MNQLSAATAVSLAILLSACQTATAFDQIRDFQQSDQDALIRVLPQIFVDPYSVQLANRTVVGVDARGEQVANTFCFSANAKNRMGGYGGLKLYQISFSGSGELLGVMDGSYTPDCKLLVNATAEMYK